MRKRLEKKKDDLKIESILFKLKVQQYYIQKDSALTNSDCQAHELCQQFDNIFLFGFV